MGGAFMNQPQGGMGNTGLGGLGGLSGLGGLGGISPGPGNLGGIPRPQASSAATSEYPRQHSRGNKKWGVYRFYCYIIFLVIGEVFKQITSWRLGIEITK